MRKRVKKKNVLKLFLILILLGVGAYFGVKTFLNNDDSNIKDTIKNKIEKKEEPKLKIINLDSKSRPYAVMINNHNAARPGHSGLQDAYMVYEIVAEGGITRYMALFLDQDTEKIGSIRSSRHYYLDYAMENDAYYVHWGWSPQAQSDISKYKINNINGLTYEGTYFYRDKSLKVDYEHTGFTSMELLKKAVDKLNYREERNKSILLDYSVKPIDISKFEDKIEANELAFKYSSYNTTNYTYDETTKTYLQSVNNKEHIDYVTKEQYTVKNIIVYQVKNYSIDDYGRQTLENIGSGKGYFITEGVAIPITWEKESRESQTVYKYNGKKITVNDGNTWIHIVPTSGNVSIS